MRKIPASVRDQIQTMVALRIYMGHILGGPDMKEKDQQKRIMDMYHGLPKSSDSESMFMFCCHCCLNVVLPFIICTNSTHHLLFNTAVSELNLLITGQGIWSGLSRPCENGEGSEIDPKFRSTTSILVNDELKAVLERKTFTSNELCNGRFLLDKAKDGMKSVKKGYSLLGNHFNLETGAVLKSESNEADAINAWLDEWFALEQDDCNKEVIDIDAAPSAAPAPSAAASIPNLQEVNDFDGPVDKNHPNYYYTCACGIVDKAVCVVCGKGYASKQQDAVTEGLAEMHHSGAFHLFGKKATAEEAPQAAKKPAAGGKSSIFSRVLF